MGADRTLSTAEQDVLAERERQRAKWGDEHDDEHRDQALAAVAAYLAHPRIGWDWPGPCEIPAPEWARGLWRKHTRRQRLIVAAALLIAEVDRLDRTGVTDGR